jgi:hypothetical protein
MTVRYDYQHQAWVVDGTYVDCGHRPEMHCRCYGRTHEGVVAMGVEENPQEPIPTPEQIQADPAASFWLKNALRLALRRDWLDAAKDAEGLAATLRNRAV